MCYTYLITVRNSNDVIQHLATMEEMSQHIKTMIPMQGLGDIDSAKNPMILTRDRLERAAAENQFMNGKIRAIDVRSFGLYSCVSMNLKHS